MNAPDRSPVARRIPAALAALLLVAMLFNAWRHDGRVGYDLSQHLKYAKTLARGRLPSAEQSKEFFNPPLPYVPAAAALAAGAGDRAALKIWQVSQVAGAAGVLWLMLRGLSASRAGPGAQTAALLVLASAAVWWRSMAMPRPEAVLAPLLLAAVDQTARLFAGRREAWRFALAGAFWGLACLSRQWAICSLLAVVPCAAFAPKPGRRWWAGVATAAGVCAVVAGPFYLSLHWRFGSVRAFNRPPVTDTALHWTFAPLAVADAPFTRQRIDRPLDILYADTFGDYWAYFLARGTAGPGRYVTGTTLIDAAAGPAAPPNNLSTLRPYLKWVLLGALPLTAFVLVALAHAAAGSALKRGRGSAFVAVPVVAVLGNLAGYAWFVAGYATTISDTDVVKATYLVQIWPLAAGLCGVFYARVTRRRPVVAAVILAGIALTVALNAGTFLSRCVER